MLVHGWQPQQLLCCGRRWGEGKGGLGRRRSRWAPRHSGAGMWQLPRKEKNVDIISHGGDINHQEALPAFSVFVSQVKLKKAKKQNETKIIIIKKPKNTTLWCPPSQRELANQELLTAQEEISTILGKPVYLSPTFASLQNVDSFISTSQNIYGLLFKEKQNPKKINKQQNRRNWCYLQK
ncbi:hypothetical protein EK904_003907, partial [Melospiza melodia maxima]